MTKVPFPYDEVCVDCARKLGGNMQKKVIGIWRGICPVCGKAGKLADPMHDFGLDLVDKEKLQELRY